MRLTFERLKSLIIFAALLLNATLSPTATAGVGFSRDAIPDPVASDTGGKLEYAIWYPSDVPSSVSRVGPYEFAATLDAPVAAGRYPLIVLSHGSGGTPLGHRNIAIALANAGFIAAAPMHPRDNFRDSSGVGHRIVWDGRPLQMRAVVDHMLSSTAWSPHVDAKRIGAFGFSLGGYTVLALIGARPSIKELIRHCDKNKSLDPLCARSGGLATAMREIYKNEYTTAPLDLGDPRICAAVVADPVAALFTRESLAQIKIPSLEIYLPEHENELTGQFHGQNVADTLRANTDVQVKIDVFENAQHYSFIAPFPDSIAASLPKAFKNRTGFDAQSFHAALEQRVVNYFEHNLQACLR